MGPRQSIKTCLRKSVTFSGRASRSEYWWFLPFGISLPIIALLTLSSFWTSLPHWQIATISFAFLLPQISVTARRLHDTGQPSSDIDVPAGALIGLLFCLLGLNGISIWADTAMSGDDSPNGLGMMLLLGPIFLVGLIASAAFLLLGLITGIPLFSQMIVPSHQTTNKYGPNPHEVTP